MPRRRCRMPVLPLLKPPHRRFREPTLRPKCRRKRRMVLCLPWKCQAALPPRRRLLLRMRLRYSQLTLHRCRRPLLHRSCQGMIPPFSRQASLCHRLHSRRCRRPPPPSRNRPDSSPQRQTSRCMHVSSAIRRLPCRSLPYILALQAGSSLHSSPAAMHRSSPVRPMAHRRNQCPPRAILARCACF